MSVPVLEVAGISRRFAGLVAVSGVKFAVRPREIFGLTGPNGAGKSTILNILAGDLSPSSGRVFVAQRRSHTSQRHV
jgi:ABC-type branched-subunit amino acid transport system ATPase component